MLQPTSKWQVNFAETQCAASREYGSAAKPLTLLFKQPVTGDVIQLAFALAQAGLAEPQQLDARLTWGNGTPEKMSGLTFHSKIGNRQLYVINLPKAEVEAASTVGELSLEGSGLHHRFKLAGLSSMLSVMNDCVKDLRNYWNMSDEGAPDRVKTHAKAVRSRLFGSDDYPAVSVRREDGGKVGVVLLVGPDGKVADCTLTQTSQVAALDAQTCAILRDRAHFQPAIGLDGKPARDVYHQRINWVMGF